MSTRGTKTSFTILLDTNAITAITLYLETCEIVGKKPDEINKRGIKNLLKEKKIKQEWLAFTDKNGIEDGYKAFKHLMEKQKKYELYVYFSLIGELEALHLFVEREFDHVLTKRGIPFRLRIKKPRRLFVDFDYNQIYEKWDSYKEKLEYQGLRLITPEKEEKEGFWYEVFIISNLLMKYILMGTVDMLMYAIAIYLRVDEIYTRDQEFKNIVRQISRPSDSTWKKISQGLKKDLENQFSSFKEGGVNFPYGVP